MGLFSKQLSNVVEWEEFRDDIIFYKWHNDEIKKGSRLIIRPGQDAIWLYNGKIEGIFTDEGNFDVESSIIPFLSTLKGFKFGFNSGIRAEVVFVNTKEMMVKWGTKNAINIQAPQLNLPGGLPIRAFGTFTCKASDYTVLMDKVAGVKEIFTIDDVKERVISQLDILLMKWISEEGKDLFDLQVNADAISRGIQDDLDMKMRSIGMSITSFAISSFSYPEEVQEMVKKVAGQAMIGDVGKYTQVQMADALTQNGGNTSAGNMATTMAGMSVGMQMGQQMMNNMNNASAGAGAAAGAGAGMATGAAPNFCPNCGTKTEGAKFCPNCGQKLV